MCGIAALLAPRPVEQAANIVAMCDLLRHRGPDGEGYVVFSDRRAQIIDRDARDFPTPSLFALGHRRLAIIDRTSAGLQPMADSGGRYWLIYNGEIYNFAELRLELESLGHQFRSNCDTEVLLAAYIEWGKECLARFNGMFAFILFDAERQSTFAARDRFGVKPLYWWRAPDGTLALASEIKAFTALPGWRARLNQQSAYDYLVWGLTDHTHRSMFQDVFPLPPGSYIGIEHKDLLNEPAPVAWYRLPKAIAGSNSPEATTERWRDLFTDAVRIRLRADTPVGTALSGGLDSSSIVCATHHLHTQSSLAGRAAFSARSHLPAFDEGEFMDAVVDATGVDQKCVWPEPDDLLDGLRQITWHMDEPFGSASVFAEWKVFRTVATTDVKVTLDGHGGDEILAGYREYSGPFFGSLLRRGRLVRFAIELQNFVRHGNVKPATLFQLVVDNVAPGRMRSALRRWTGRTVATPDWIDGARLKHVASNPFPHAGNIDELARAQLLSTSLPMQLHWNDRNSMASSIESRAPFLDYRLVEFTLGLADHFKISQGISKRVLRAAMKGTVPEAVLARRDKMGFVTAEEIWVRQERPERFRAAFAHAVEVSKGIFTPQAITMCSAMIDGRTPYNNRFWRILNFGAWIDCFNVEIPS
jgi:asparagine synthase (glutamine-hydrolysing)